MNRIFTKAVSFFGFAGKCFVLKEVVALGTDMIIIAEEKLEISFGAVVCTDGIVFLKSTGEIVCVMYFKDFGVKPFKHRYQTERLCRRLRQKNDVKGVRELHSSNTSVSDTFGIN